MTEDGLSPKKEGHPSPPPQRPKQTIMALLWIVSLLAIFALLALQWQEKTRLDSVSLKYGQDKAMLMAFDERLQKTQEGVSELKQKIFKSNHMSDTLASTQKKLARLLDSRQWKLTEAQYIIHIAFERLQAFSDISMAIIQLQEAEKLLRFMADPTLTEAREILANDIVVLKSVSVPDQQGLWAKIDALKNAVIALMVNVQHVAQQSADVGVQSIIENSEEAETPIIVNASPRWKKSLQNTWKELKGLVKVRRHGPITIPLLSQQEQGQIQRTLILFLEQARWAMLHGEQKVYEKSLHNALEWLTTYFEQNKATQQVVDNLHQLIAYTVQVDVPDISASVKIIDNIVNNNAEAQIRENSLKKEAK